MRGLKSEAIVFAAGLALFCAAPVLAADEGTALSTPAHVEMTDDGPVLVTPTGVTLYVNAADTLTHGQSACKNTPSPLWEDQQGGLGMVPIVGASMMKTCAQKWPPYLADDHAQADGNFALIDRPEGGKQWTYKGRPLYMSVRDHKPGDRNGITGSLFGGLGRGFSLATERVDFPLGMKITRSKEGLILVTTNERPVYTPHGVRISKVCAGCDEDAFQPLLAPAMAAVSGDWSIIDAGAGRHQFAFRGQPLYAAPAGMTDDDIREAGGWQAVVFRKSPGTPSDIKTQMTLIGEVYATKEGHTLYTFNCNSPVRGSGVRCDDPGDPAGYWVALCGSGEECAKRWHPYLADANARPVGEWSVVDVAYPMFTKNPGTTYPPESPRVKAWAFRGMPLYTYYEDKEAGETWGNVIKWVLGSNFAALQVPGREIREN